MFDLFLFFHEQHPWSRNVVLLAKSAGVCLLLWVAFSAIKSFRRYQKNKSELFQARGVVRAIAEPEDVALLLFLKRSMSFSLRWRLAVAGKRFGGAYADPLFFVGVVRDAFLDSLFCCLDHDVPTFTIQKWRDRTLALLDEENPASTNLYALAFISAGFTKHDMELMYWVHHQEIVSQTEAERDRLKGLFAQRCDSLDERDEDEYSPSSVFTLFDFAERDKKR